MSRSPQENKKKGSPPKGLVSKKSLPDLTRDLSLSTSMEAQTSDPNNNNNNNNVSSSVVNFYLDGMGEKTLGDMQKKDLQKLCDERRIHYTSRTSKKDLVSFLMNHKKTKNKLSKFKEQDSGSLKKYPTVGSGQPFLQKVGADPSSPVPISIEEQKQWYVAREKITVRELLGKGSFGNVYLAEWQHTKVAYKKAHDNNLFNEFYNECTIMLKLVSHPKIVQLLRICEEDCGILMEYSPNGSLLQWLRQKKSNITLREISFICKDIAAGLAYLHSQNVVHRDLAARNVLMFPGDPVVCKISDYGMSRAVNFDTGYTQSDFGPYLHMAPECFEKKYSTRSDVYSYAITLVEVVSGGKPPYSNVGDIVGFIKGVKEGVLRPAIPKMCPSEIHKIIEQCWNSDENKRPTAAHIAEILTRVTEELDK